MKTIVNAQYKAVVKKIEIIKLIFEFINDKMKNKN